MNRSLAIKITSTVLVLLALVAALLPFIVGQSSLLEPLIIILTADFLFKSNKLSILLLSISALLYLGGGLIEAYSQGLSPAALRSAFYWSFVVRLLFVIWAAYLLTQPNSLLAHYTSRTPKEAP